MKVGILTNTFPPNINGVSVAIESLSNSLWSRGIEVYIATPKIENAIYPDYVLPIEADDVDDKFSPDLRVPSFYINKVGDFFKSKGVDIIHTHDTILGGPEGVMIALKLNIPCIHTFHTLIESYEYFRFPGYRRFIRNYTKQVCSNYDYVIAPSEKVYNYLLKLGATSPIEQILNVPKLDDLDIVVNAEEKMELKHKLGILDSDFVFITFCRLAKEKGLDTGLKVMQKVLQNNSNCKYMICGSGQYEEDLKKLAENLGIAKQIIFTGKYQRKELPVLTSLANSFFFTSTTENLPTNIFEAMYLGLPVVSIDDSSVDYLLINEKNGFKQPLENLAQTCQKLLDNPALAKKMGENAKKTAQQLKNQDITLQHIQLYQRILERFNENNSRPSLVEMQNQLLYSLLEKGINSVRKVIDILRLK